MKIKFDYVTNSSSTSFTGYGIKLKNIPERLWHLLYNYAKAHNEENNYDMEDMNFEEFVLNGRIGGVFQDFIEDFNLNIKYCQEESVFFIGIKERGHYDVKIKKYIYDESTRNPEKVKEIFKVLFSETAIVDFNEMIEKIEFIDKEWYQ